METVLAGFLGLVLIFMFSCFCWVFYEFVKFISKEFRK